ncbi:hypothetical protein [Pseudomonas aeruginosa]|uniref:hypothetical protein n=1 Tax=Pseudomonas aeruginosa TaxID=287 RepID=UPI001A9D9649
MRENAVIQAFRAVAETQPEGVDLLVAEAGALVDAEDAAAAQRRPRDAGAGRDRLAGVELQMLALVAADEGRGAYRDDTNVALLLGVAGGLVEGEVAAVGAAGIDAGAIA